MAASFEQLLDENLSTVIMKQGSLVTGIVIDILENHVVVHVGLKSEAVVPGTTASDFKPTCTTTWLSLIHI